MVSELMDDMPDTYKNLLAQLEPKTHPSDGAAESKRRLSIRDGVFRKVVDGKEDAAFEASNLKVVIVKVSPVSRMYYEGQYVAGKTTAPKCWSADANTHRASDDVSSTDRQGRTCNECPQNIRGSGMGGGKACRQQQRVALVLADQDGQVVFDERYMLSLPATSIHARNTQRMGLKVYAKHLAAFQAPIATVLTELSFDEDSSMPRVCFKPLRALNEDEVAAAKVIQKDPNTKNLVAFNPKPYVDDGPNMDNVFGTVKGDGVYVKNL